MPRKSGLRWFIQLAGVLLTAAALLSVTPLALAQSDRGTITGTVSDPTGASVPANVTIRNVETGVEYPTVATSTGNYTVSSLPVGHYNLIVGSAGFSTYVQAGITVQ